MVIFKFIDDKDVFQKFYQKKLAQRLVNSASASDDSESSMITKLKELSGFDYTNKLTRMFTGPYKISQSGYCPDIVNRYEFEPRSDGEVQGTATATGHSKRS
jgi:hypothetical protein